MTEKQFKSCPKLKKEKKIIYYFKLSLDTFPSPLKLWKLLQANQIHLPLCKQVWVVWYFCYFLLIAGGKYLLPLYLDLFFF